MPVIRAEASLREMQRIGVGVRLKPEAAQQALKSWQQDAKLTRFGKRTVPATPQMLAGAGIGFHMVEKK